MATRKRKTTIERFKDVYEDLKLPELKFLDVTLYRSLETCTWIETGEIDFQKDYVEVELISKDPTFNQMMSSDVAAEIGFSRLFFNVDTKKYLISDKWKTGQEKREFVQKIFKALVEVDDKISKAIEYAPKVLSDEVEIYGNSFETEDFLVEYDVEKSRCYIVLKDKTKGYGSILYKATNPPIDSIWNGEAYDVKRDKGAKDERFHKVKNIPGYKEKSHLKNFVRNQCFWIHESKYLMIRDLIKVSHQEYLKKMSSVEKWIKENGIDRLKKVEIKEANEFGLSIHYDEKKGFFKFAVKNFEYETFTLANRITSSGYRKNPMDFLFYNEVLTRPEKPNDINRAERVETANHDDMSLWEFKGLDLDPNYFDKSYSKVFLQRKGDSKGKVLNLDIEKNIEDLEVIKENYLNFKKNFLNKCEEVNLGEYPFFYEEKKYPFVFWGEDAKPYLIFEAEKKINGKDTYDLVAKKAFPISEELFKKIFIDKDFANMSFVENVRKETCTIMSELKIGKSLNYLSKEGQLFLQSQIIERQTKLTMRKISPHLNFNTDVDLLDNEKPGNNIFGGFKL